MEYRIAPMQKITPPTKTKHSRPRGELGKPVDQRQRQRHEQIRRELVGQVEKTGRAAMVHQQRKADNDHAEYQGADFRGPEQMFAEAFGRNTGL